jgi:outer membrane receptor protein involved in Fe transport
MPHSDPTLTPLLRFMKKHHPCVDALAIIYMATNKVARAPRLVAGLVAYGLLLGAHAQDTAADDDTIFDLSPFEVESAGDIGYLSTNAISGTRLNMPIRDIPMSLEVINTEFIRDIGATDFKESLAYSAGVFTEVFVNTTGAGPASGDRSPSSSAGVGDERNNAISIRGFNAPFQMRMGFRIGTFIGVGGGATSQGGGGRGGFTLGSLVDSVNVERNEVVRGPGALLYGLGVISGIVNVMPNRPLDKARTTISTTAGSDGLWRAAFDTTGPLLRASQSRFGQLNYRAMFSWQEQGDWTEFHHQDRSYGAFQLDWRPVRSLKIFAEYQAGTARFEGNGARTLRSASEWTDPFGRPYTNEFGESNEWGRDTFAGRYPDIWDPAKWPEIWNQPLPPATTAGIAPLSGPFMPRNARITGPDPFYERTEWSTIVNAQWTPTANLAFNVGYYYTEQDIHEFSLNAFVIRDRFGLVQLNPAAYNYERIPSDYVFRLLKPQEERLLDRVEYRAIGTYWTNQPAWAASEQIRGEVNYRLETPFLFDSVARHSLLVGIHNIRDEAYLPVGPTPFNQIIRELDFVANTQAKIGINDDGDGFKVRSFYDWMTPIRYEGEPIVRGAADYFDTTLWYNGLYAVYQGQLFQDKLTVIGGLRHDRYQAKEARWTRADYNPDQVRTGTMGEPYYNFDQAVKVSTGSFGLSYSFSDALSMYAVISEGVIPNTGLRDGNGLAIEPEQTFSKEIGFKFDLRKGKISGTISVFQIDRENAVWAYANAPAPGKWEGGRFPFQGNSLILDPELKLKGAPINYGFSYQLYFRDKLNDPVEGARWRQKLGITRHPLFGTLLVPFNNPRLVDGQLIGNPAPGVVQILQPGSMNQPDAAITNDFRPYIFITYDQIKSDPELKAIADQALEDFASGNHPDNINPIFYGVLQDGISGFNASANAGGNVTFEEQSIGFDGQLIFTPNENLQFIVSFAHIKREASSAFNLAQAADYRFPELQPFGTEYDIWVRDFGAEAFADPTDPTTLQGGIKGKSLFFGSENTANVWGKYSFTEGRLRGFSVGLGLRYASGARTSIPIGGANMAINRYSTPDTEDLYQVNSALMYNRRFERFDLRLALNIYNLLNKKELYTEVTYQNTNFPELTETRRSRVYLTPINFRLSATISF